MKSDCCWAEVKVCSSEEGTSWYECSKCGEGCDIAPEWPSADEVEEALKEWQESNDGEYFQGMGFRAGVRWLRERMGAK